jgi:hypothetical protein
MPTINQSTEFDTSNYERIMPQIPPVSSEAESLLPRRSVIQVCSLPYIPGIFPSTNNIIDFHLGGKIPHCRAPLPAQTPAQGTGMSTTKTVIASTASASTATLPQSQVASITSPVLNPGNAFAGIVLLSKSNLFLQLAASAPARIRLYSTANAQSSDLSRSLSLPPGLGTVQGIFSDIQLDTVPLLWKYSETVGSNMDTPQSNTIYITFNNIGVASTAITATITYVPLQS